MIKNKANKAKAKADKKAAKSELTKKVNEFKASSNVVDVKQRIIDGKLQYYTITKDGVRAVINADGSTSSIVQIGRKKGKKVFVSLDKLRQAAKDANIENAESLMKVPKGYECKVDETGNVTLEKITNKNKDKKEE